MPTMEFKCPSCGKPCRAYVDKSTSFKCSACGTKIKPHENGKVDIVTEIENKPTVEPLKAPAYTPPKSASTPPKPKEEVTNLRAAATNVVEPEPKRPIVQPTPRSTNDSSYSIWPYVVGVLLVVAYYGWNDFIKPKSASKPPVAANQTVQYPQQTQAPAYQTPPTATTTPAYQTPVSSPPQTTGQQSSENANSGIIYLHTVNTYQGTDKMDKCSSVLDETSHTLTLTSITHPSNSFKIIYQDGGVCNFQYYSDNTMEAEKTIYRRSDLETGNGTLIYTSRTGEITISISY